MVGIFNPDKLLTIHTESAMKFLKLILNFAYFTEELIPRIIRKKP